MPPSSTAVELARPVLRPERIRELWRRLDGRSAPPAIGGSWEQGTPAAWLDALITDWRAFDVAPLQHAIDGMAHRIVTVSNHRLSVFTIEGRGPEPLPLILTHGWPGSFLEYLHIVRLLTDPSGHGADAADAFTVILPSLPGFGFSGPPPSCGMTARQVAALWHRVMAEGLGHRRYVAHGSDLGAGVTAWLARDRPDSVLGIHLATPGLAAPEGRRSPAEQRFADEVVVWSREEGGYLHEQATKPATLAAALADSPAGMAAWIGEKVRSWSSEPSDGGQRERDTLLGTLTLYWATETIGTSLLPYWTYAHVGEPLPADDPTPVPTSVGIFGGERVPFPKPPRQLADRYFHVVDWAEHAAGGHFPATSEPELLADELRRCFRPLR